MNFKLWFAVFYGVYTPMNTGNFVSIYQATRDLSVSCRCRVLSSGTVQSVGNTCFEGPQLQKKLRSEPSQILTCINIILQDTEQIGFSIFILPQIHCFNFS